MSGMIELLEIGKPLQLTKIAPYKALDIIQREFEAKGIEAQLTYWTDPAEADPSLGCKFTYVMRCDGMSEVEIDIAKGETANGSDSFIFDAAAWADNWKRKTPASVQDRVLSRPHRESQTGWETLTVGGSGKLVRFYKQDLKSRLGLAMLKRGLTGVFRCERQRMFDDPAKRGAPWWLVTRIK